MRINLVGPAIALSSALACASGAAAQTVSADRSAVGTSSTAPAAECMHGSMNLDTVGLSESDRYPKLRTVGFFERLRQGRRGALDASFLTPDEIVRRHADQVSHLVEGFRSAHVQYVGNFRAIPYGRDGRCAMSIWLDGHPVDLLFSPEFEAGRSDLGTFPGLNFIDVNTVAAVELYPSLSGTPAQFQHGTGCGAIVIWTR